MIISFHIEYRTNWGEEVRILGSIPELGNNVPEKAILLYTIDGIHWTADVEINLPANQNNFEYNYYIYQDKQPIRHEWQIIPRKLFVSIKDNHKYSVYDAWKNLPEDSYFYSSTFTDSLFAHPNRDELPEGKKQGILIKAYAPRITGKYCLAISGNQSQTGNWNADEAIPMSNINFPEWQVELDGSQIQQPFEYKFVLYNKETRKAEAWESNPNRYLSVYSGQENETVVISDRYAYFDIPAWKGAGVAIPVFSLRSENSYGIGDFGDLKKMIDWTVKTDQKIVQILPINDTTMTGTWRDSYPYSSISIYAFHPLYVNLDKMGKLKKKDAESFAKRQKELNSQPFMDYEAVFQTKWEYFRLIFAQEGHKVLASDQFRTFFESNKEWLLPYAAFSYLRDKYNTPDFRQWPEHSVYNAREIEEFCRPGTPGYTDIAIYYYIQFHLHLQLLEATTYARENGVALKGDIPIGISPNSVEAWTEPYYFNLNGQAGAPPDDFSVNGQNWGLPTYNWDIMEKDGYKWWMKRFRKMAEYFDAYRIDHILGFFRIWEIPLNAVHGLLGQFVPAIPMTREEIESYGLQFREDFFLNPYIHESFLKQIFRPHTEYVKENFIEPTDIFEVYRMRPEFDTQRKIESYFADKTDMDSLWIRDGLYSLISNVLFVRDRKDTEKYHPRISAQHDFLYKALPDWEKDAFNRLYDQYFYHRHTEFWRQQAMQKLPQLTQSTRMLVCGEDLGMIPESVPWVMNDLRILSLEIQRMPKNPNIEFGHLDEYPYRSVCTISTHDMSTLRGWWEEDYPKTQRYFNSMLHHYGTAPQVATPEICQEVVRNHLYSNSILSIIALQDWMSIDGQLRNPDVHAERINIPADPKHYWRYRMHITLEELLEADSLNDKIREYIQLTGRNSQT